MRVTISIIGNVGMIMHPHPIQQCSDADILDHHGSHYAGAPNPSHATWNTLWMYTFATNASLFAGFYANYPDTPACNQYVANPGATFCQYEAGGWWPESSFGTLNGYNLPGQHSMFGMDWEGTFGVWGDKPILWMVCGCMCVRLTSLSTI